MKKWKKTLLSVAVGAASAVGVAALALPALGFTASGVAAGSVAAMWQSSIGNVVAGSTFAALQSAGVLGLPAIAQAGSAAVGGVLGGVGHAVLSNEKDKKKSSDESGEGKWVQQRIATCDCMKVMQKESVAAQSSEAEVVKRKEDIVARREDNNEVSEGNIVSEESEVDEEERKVEKEERKVEKEERKVEKEERKVEKEGNDRNQRKIERNEKDQD